MNKGLDAPTIIGIIIAVIAGALILYFLWAKGLLPFIGGATKAECDNNLIKACSGQILWEDFKVKYSICVNYFRGTEKSDLEACLADPISNSVACDDFCSSFLGA